MTDEQREIWFPAKKYGWGWGLPISWQGWLVLATYFALALIGAVLLARPPRVAAAYLVYMALLSTLLVVVCWFKGEKPRWRKGGK